MAYDIDAEIDVGDPNHVGHHEALAAAVNDIDTVRIPELFPKIMERPGSPALDVGDDNRMEFVYNGIMRAWWNEWTALRGRNPYASWADALVRGIVDDGDNTSGNFAELEDRRSGAGAYPLNILFGVNWGTGQIMQGGALVGCVYMLDIGDTEADIPPELPPNTVIMRRVA